MVPNDVVARLSAGRMGADLDRQDSTEAISKDRAFRICSAPPEHCRELAMTGNLRFLSLCSGAGGLDIGLEMAGWRPLAQVEIDRDCCATLQALSERSLHPAKVIHAGLETIDPRELRLALGLKRGELELIADLCSSHSPRSRSRLHW